MNLSKRKLTNWRKEALVFIKCASNEDETLGCTIVNAKLIKSSDRVLAMTQELIDQHLIEEVKKDASPTK